jgi:glycine cleavage system aminomethyltransferase T
MSTTADPTATAAADRALREGCGLLDRSERGKLAVSGGEARSTSRAR